MNPTKALLILLIVASSFIFPAAAISYAHAASTTVRLDASYISLPKKIRTKTKIRKFVKTSKQLFKLNSQVRDCDIIFEKLQKYSSELIYTKLIRSLNRKRKTKLASARKIALSLRDLSVPRVRENEIPAKQL